MKKIIPLILIFFVFFLQFKAVSFLHLFPSKLQLSSSEKKIYWQEQLDQACEQAMREKKFLFLYFVKKGSSWCSKMEKEILEQNGFFQEMKDKFIFVKLLIDQSPKEARFFHVTEAPSVLLLDLQKEKMAQMGYLPVSGRKYAQEVKRIVNEYFVSIESHKESKKRDVGHFLSKRALETTGGMGSSSSPNSCFFSSLFDHYAELLQRQEIDASFVLECRKELEDLDPHNHLGFHLQLALEEFHALAKKSDPEKAVAPLLHYIDLFGKKEKENIWLLHMTISQFFFQEGRFDKALFHARASFRLAPLPIKKELATTIRYLKEKAKSSESFPRDNL
jgi:protein disulfide-isomerase